MVKRTKLYEEKIDEVSREEYLKFKKLQISGTTNMLDVKLVSERTGLSVSKVGLILIFLVELDTKYGEQK